MRPIRLSFVCTDRYLLCLPLGRGNLLKKDTHKADLLRGLKPFRAEASPLIFWQ